MRAGIGARVCAAAIVAAGCIGDKKSNASGDTSGPPSPPPPVDPGPPPPPPPPPVAPIQQGAWTYYGPQQGLSDDIQDVSADEDGNVYVAGGDALYVKRPADQGFLRFDASNAGLTRNCNDYTDFHNETPAKAFYTCRILAVAGAAPGRAVIGFDSFGIESQNGALWTYSAGGADVVAFDPVARTLARQRHVWLASPPHTICTTPVYARATTCVAGDYWWDNGRRMFVQVRRIVVNHDRSSPMYGDVWLGGQHATFATILANAAARGLPDHTAGFLPAWADAKDVWEHEHPNLDAPDGTFVNGLGWALSIDPRDGTPWGSNQYRTTYISGYGASLATADVDWGMGPRLDLWPTPPNQWGMGGDDQVRSMSHCSDGTLWVGSLTHGLARIDPGGQISFTSLPDPALENSVSVVACDPTDASLWIGLGAGGVMRLRSGGWERLDTSGLPAFTQNPVQSIQIDRWSATRTVYFAFSPITDDSGRLQGGGVGAYAGP